MICLLGGYGYVGSSIAAALRAQGTEFVILRRCELDYYQPTFLAEWLRRHEVEFLVNATGFTGRPNVDACEGQRAECLLANAVLPGIIRTACESAHIPFGHVSSGCIYSGAKSDGSGFKESDPPNFCFRTNNCSFYSGSKALGEEVLDDCSCCYVWRLRIPFNHIDGPRNYLSKILRYERLLDVRNSLSHLDDVAKCCVECIASRLPFGIYNLTNSDSITTREITEMIAETIAPNKTFEFFNDEAEFMRESAIAPRSHCVLDNRKAVETGLPLRPVREALYDSLLRWQPLESLLGETPT